MFSMEIDSDFNSERMANLQENKAADNCFIIFISGRYVQILNQVLEKVETIGKEIGLHPLGLFIAEEINDHNSKFTNYADCAKFPLVIFM